MIDKNIINALPSHSGVYLFKRNNHILYVGKSINIKERIKNHFEQTKNNSKEKKLFDEANKIEYLILDSDLKITLKEAELIKKYRPKYNVRWKDDKNFLYIKITNDKLFPKVLLVRKEKDKQSKYFGPFGSKKEALTILREIRKVIPFCTELKLSNKPCLYSKINRCNPCPNYISGLNDSKERKRLINIYKNNIRAVNKVLSGEFNFIIDRLNNQLKKLIKKENFEEAIKIREKLKMFFQLTEKKTLINNSEQFDFKFTDKSHLLTDTLKKYFPKLQRISRIEGYDISNLNFRERTGSMVVFYNGIADKSQYRRFKVEENRSDNYMMKEVLQRRFNNRWPLPDLIVIDGGVTQLKSVIEVLNKREIKIPVVGIAKNPDRLIIPCDSGFKKIKLADLPGGEIIIALRNESHRFAKKYHVLLRNKLFLS
jgi:excinuclease ABC subunit C